MKLQGTYTFDVDIEQLWQALLDPVVLGEILYLCENVQKIDENEYEGSLRFSAGAYRGTYQGTLSLTNVNPPHSYNVIVNGQGIPGVVRMTGGIIIEPQGKQTKMTYHGDLSFGGRLASVAQRILEIAVKSVIYESLIALNRYLIAESTKAN